MDEESKVAQRPSLTNANGEKPSKKLTPEQTAREQNNKIRFLNRASIRELYDHAARRYRDSQKELSENVFDLQGYMVCYHDFQNNGNQLEADRKEASKLINQVGGGKQLSVNPELATKSKFIRHKVNLIVCNSDQFREIIKLFVKWR